MGRITSIRVNVSVRILQILRKHAKTETKTEYMNKSHVRIHSTKYEKVHGVTLLRELFSICNGRDGTGHWTWTWSIALNLPIKSLSFGAEKAAANDSAKPNSPAAQGLPSTITHPFVLMLTVRTYLFHSCGHKESIIRSSNEPSMSTYK